MNLDQGQKKEPRWPGSQLSPKQTPYAPTQEQPQDGSSRISWLRSPSGSCFCRLSPPSSCSSDEGPHSSRGIKIGSSSGGNRGSAACLSNQQHTVCLCGDLCLTVLHS